MIKDQLLIWIATGYEVIHWNPDIKIEIFFDKLIHLILAFKAMAEFQLNATREYELAWSKIKISFSRDPIRSLHVFVSVVLQVHPFSVFILQFWMSKKLRLKLTHLIIIKINFAAEKKSANRWKTVWLFPDGCIHITLVSLCMLT